jgi:hypothetical protein
MLVVKRTHTFTPVVQNGWRMAAVPGQAGKGPIMCLNGWRIKNRRSRNAAPPEGEGEDTAGRGPTAEAR